MFDVFYAAYIYYMTKKISLNENMGKHLLYFPDYEAPPDPGHSLSSEKQRGGGTLAQVKG